MTAHFRGDKARNQRVILDEGIPHGDIKIFDKDGNLKEIVDVVEHSKRMAKYMKWDKHGVFMALSPLRGKKEDKA